jgi:glycosyltransferase involved in cell wall biosynthesis
MSEIDLSIVLPIFEEEESIPHLITEIHQALQSHSIHYEIVAIDDGSRDRSFEVLQTMAHDDPHLVVVQFRRNFGQTAAMQAGLDLAHGKAIAFMDADLQNDPHDIPAMYERLHQGYDLVAGWRHKRKDRWINRRLPSMVANRLIAWVTGVRLHDYGCSLKLLQGDLAKTLRLYGEMHRFIPAIASWSGARIVEMQVNHRARTFGVSKYGIGRIIRVLLDLLVVRFMQSYLVKPMQIFGLAGLSSGLLGTAICGYLALQKFLYQQALAERPLLLLGILLIMIGVQLVSLGLVADLLARTYHEAQDKPPYHIRNCIRGSDFSTQSTNVTVDHES